MGLQNSSSAVSRGGDKKYTLYCSTAGHSLQQNSATGLILLTIQNLVSGRHCILDKVSSP